MATAPAARTRGARASTDQSLIGRAALKRGHIEDMADEKAHQTCVECAFPEEQGIAQRAENEPGQNPTTDHVAARPPSESENDECQRRGVFGKYFECPITDADRAQQADDAGSEDREQDEGGGHGAW